METLTVALTSFPIARLTTMFFAYSVKSDCQKTVVKPAQEQLYMY